MFFANKWDTLSSKQIYICSLYDTFHIHTVYHYN